jgi:hypothetical protein
MRWAGATEPAVKKERADGKEPAGKKKLADALQAQ